jgi:Tfp pilus assembly protein PilO
VGIVAAVAATIVAASALFSLQAANEKLISQILHAQHQTSAPITPEQGLTRVVTDLPTRAQMPKVLEQVLQQAQQAGVELNKGQYSYSPSAKGDVARYELDFPVTAQYPAVREFIDRILTHIPAAGLHKLTIQRKVIGDSQVTADVRFVIFIRDR